MGIFLAFIAHANEGYIQPFFDLFELHLQIILTGYEITIRTNVKPFPIWARILKQISHILLVVYSALNPLAYCGELIFNQLAKVGSL